MAKEVETHGPLQFKGFKEYLHGLSMSFYRVRGNQRGGEAGPTQMVLPVCVTFTHNFEDVVFILVEEYRVLPVAVENKEGTNPGQQPGRLEGLFSGQILINPRGRTLDYTDFLIIVAPSAERVLEVEEMIAVPHIDQVRAGKGMAGCARRLRRLPGSRRPGSGRIP